MMWWVCSSVESLGRITLDLVEYLGEFTLNDGEFIRLGFLFFPE